MNTQLQMDRDVSTKYKSLVSFVSKDFSPSNMPLTVKEILYFAVRFKVPLYSNNPLWTTRDERLSLLLNAYGLKNKENAPFQTLSSGDKRRLSIAVQNVLFNRVILLEYPTDGIEFGESFHLLKKMQVLANLGITIVMCLHRPSILELELFDYVSILYKGSTIYFGKPNMIQEYFNLIGVQLPLYRQNVLISVLELLKLHELSKSSDENDQQLVRECLGGSDEKSYEKRDHLNVEFEQRMDLFYIPQKQREQAPYLQYKIEDMETEKYYSDYFFSILFLLERSYLVKFRRWKTDILSPILEKLIVSVFIGLLYLQIEPTNMTLKGKIFSFLNLNISITFGLALRTLTSQLPLLAQERNSRSYRIGAFYIAKSIEDMADFIFQNLVFGLTIYLMAGLSYRPEHIFAFILIFSVYNLACISCAQALASIIPIPSVLNLIAPVVSLIFTVVSGAYSVTSTQFLNWVGYLSFLYYGFRALTINEFRDVMISSPTAPNGTVILPPGHFTNGTLYLQKTFGITDPRYMMWVYFGVLCAYFAICKAAGYFGLRYIYRGTNLKGLVRMVIFDWCTCCCCFRKRAKKKRLEIQQDQTIILQQQRPTMRQTHEQV